MYEILVNNAINYQPQLVNARVLNHQQYVMLTFVSTSEQVELKLLDSDI